MPVVKTITYDNLEEKHKKNPKILPFKYKKPFPQEIEEWKQPPEEDETRKSGIMRVASAKDDKDYLKMILSRYYTRNELFGKTIRELNKLLELHINIQGGLIR